MLRFIKFNAVGLIGFGVQMGVLALLVRIAEWPYIWATLLAVETAVLHNFVWHERWTWRDRAAHSFRGILRQLVRFHLLNGLTSLLGNAAVVALLVELLQVPVLSAGVVAVGVCTIANFLWAHRVVFRAEPSAEAG